VREHVHGPVRGVLATRGVTRPGSLLKYS